MADDVCCSQQIFCKSSKLWSSQRFRNFPENSNFPENLATRPPGRGRGQWEMTTDRSLFQFNCVFVKNHATYYPMTLIFRKRWNRLFWRMEQSKPWLSSFNTLLAQSHLVRSRDCAFMNQWIREGCVCTSISWHWKEVVIFQFIIIQFTEDP